MRFSDETKSKALVAAREWQRKFVGSTDEATSTALWIDDIAREAGLGPDIVFKLQMCAEELLANVIRHGGSSDLEVWVAIRFSGRALELTIEDNGQPFDVTAATPRKIDRPLDVTEPGGLGIGLVHRFSDGLTYKHSGDRNCTTVIFQLGKSAAA
jgi:serine/threonine-protein kinase RsbW